MATAIPYSYANMFGDERMYLVKVRAKHLINRHFSLYFLIDLTFRLFDAYEFKWKHRLRL